MPVTDPPPARFDAFISYARRNDVNVVAGIPVRPVSELEEALESHRHPETGEPLRVCTDVALGGTVEGAILDKLRASRGLVICSEEFAGNAWVSREIDWFAGDKPAARRIGVALGRLPGAAFPAGFPERLFWALPVEPMHDL